jgi:hypothetical protein
MSTVPWLDELQRDVKFGARQMVAAPTYTVVAVLTLALGIGATAAMFSVVGVYGLVHYAVATRTQEIGIRTAVGARAARRAMKIEPSVALQRQ